MITQDHLNWLLSEVGRIVLRESESELNTLHIRIDFNLVSNIPLVSLVRRSPDQNCHKCGNGVEFCKCTKPPSTPALPSSKTSTGTVCGYCGAPSHPGMPCIGNG